MSEFGEFAPVIEKLNLMCELLDNKVASDELIVQAWRDALTACRSLKVSYYNPSVN